MKTSKKLTLEVLGSNYLTTGDKINGDYLCHTLSLEICNNEKLINDVRYNKRRTIKGIVWNAFLKNANDLLNWHCYESYSATSEHLKSFINNDYSILNPLYEELEAERQEAQEEKQ